MAQYGVNETNEVFTMDDLGNRDSVKLKGGSNVAYSVNNTNNRYNTVGSNSLTYDAAGNLITDKDSYNYQYDYENRLMRTTKNSNNIAEFAYDALGRRIRKIDSIAGQTTLYYYGSGWQALNRLE